MVFLNRSIAYREILGFKWWYLLFNGVLFVLFLLIRGVAFDPFIGLLMGSVFSLLNFYIMGVTIERSMQKTSGLSAVSVGIGYIIRAALMLAVLYAASRISMDTFISAVLPLFFPRIILTLKSRKGSEGSCKEQK